MWDRSLGCIHRILCCLLSFSFYFWYANSYWWPGIPELCGILFCLASLLFLTIRYCHSIPKVLLYEGPCIVEWFSHVVFCIYLSRIQVILLESRYDNTNNTKSYILGHYRALIL